MFRKVFIWLLAAAAGAAAMSINDWLAVNGTNSVVFLRQREDGRRWTWDILQTEVWAWRFAVGAEGEFDHPRKPAFESRNVADPEGNELVQRYIRYRDNMFDVRAGTYDKTLGKGLTLRSYEDRDFDVYQRLDGGLADVSFDFRGRHWADVSALWGRNKRDDDLQADPDRVAGGQITVSPVDFAYLTGSFAEGDVENWSFTPAVMEEERLAAGGLGGGWNYFDVYGEYAVRRGYNFLTAEDDPGKGFYGVLNGYLPRSSVSVEFKRYDDLVWPYNNPPPASPDSRTITGVLSNSRGEWGYYAQATANPLDPFRVHGGYSFADDVVGENKLVTHEIEEYFVKTRYDLSSPVVLEAGYEHVGDLEFPRDPKGEIVTTVGEVERTPWLGVSLTPFADHSFSAKAERERRIVYTRDAIFIDRRFTVGYTYSSWLGLTVDYEGSNELVQEAVDPGDPLAQPPVPPTYRYKNDWLWGELRLTWYNELFQNHVLSIGYGSRRGGYVCSSGVCKQEAPFSGLRVMLESSF